MTKQVADPLRPLEDVLKVDERCAGQSIADLHAGLQTLVLRDSVPIGVRQLFETAKNARLYTHFVYRFHQVAEMLAYQALERGLKEKWSRDCCQHPPIPGKAIKAPGLFALLQLAMKKEWIRNEGFSTRMWRAQQSILSERTSIAIASLTPQSTGDLEILEPTAEEVAERAKQIEIVRMISEMIPKMRNDLAHGSTMLAPTSDLVLQDVCDALNMLFDQVCA